jgi:hypothetical protein
MCACTKRLDADQQAFDVLHIVGEVPADTARTFWGARRRPATPTCQHGR